jgi:Polyketide cyclase / dehydrase and lipid transport
MTRLPVTLASVDEAFFDSAPLVVRDSIPVKQPAAEVWDELTRDNPLGWCRILDRVAWQSPRPFGVGTKRFAKSLKGLVNLDEFFFRWEEGRQMSFYVERTNSPLFRRFAEDYLVAPVDAASSTSTWTVAVEPRALAAPAAGVNRRLLGTLHTDARRHFGAS